MKKLLLIPIIIFCYGVYSQSKTTEELEAYNNKVREICFQQIRVRPEITILEKLSKDIDTLKIEIRQLRNRIK